MRRGFDEVVLLLNDLRDTRETVDLGIHEIQNLFFELFGLGLQRLFLGGPLLAPVVDHAFDLVAVEVHEYREWEGKSLEEWYGKRYLKKHKELLEAKNEEKINHHSETLIIQQSELK